MARIKALLLGGAGFLGSGLQNVFKKKNIDFTVLDKDHINFEDPSCIYDLSNAITESSHIFILASKLGARLFETNPAVAGFSNLQIYQNIANSITLAKNPDLNVFLYSTSEVYWSMPNSFSYISNSVPDAGNIDKSNSRSIYSLVKLYAEYDFFQRQRLFGEFSRLVVIRPFNVYGPYQKRGVVYEMLKSAVREKIIRYTADTTRTITSLSYISEKTCELLNQPDKFYAVNMSDGISTSMFTLARAVARMLDENYDYAGITLEQLSPDKSIRYRQAGPLAESEQEIIDFFNSSNDFDKLVKQVFSE